MTLALGLDLGSTTTKAVLIEISATGETRLRRVERRASAGDPAALLVAAAEVLRACAYEADAPIAAVGVAAMGESGAALDGSGAALTGILRWDGRRDPAHLGEVLGRRPDLPETTGIPATAKPAAVVLTALRAEQPEVFARMRHWAGVADLVVHALTGARTTDHTLAARTMLSRDRGETWDAGILGDLGIPPGVLPERRPAAGPPRTTAAASGFGLGPGIPVVVAGHDHAVGAWAAGVRRPGQTADSLGTAEAVVRIADAVDVAAAVASGFAVGPSADGAALTILGGSSACGALLSWWGREHPADRALERLSALRPDAWDAASTLVLPYPSGRQCPDPDPGARLRVEGPPSASAEDRVRGLLQSLVLHARWMRESADRLAGSPTHEVTVLGSLADRIPPWAPLTASATPSTERCAAAEPVAAGAALLAAVRTGAAAPGTALPRTPVAAARTTGMDAAYRRFLALVRAEPLPAGSAPDPTPEETP